MFWGKSTAEHDGSPRLTKCEKFCFSLNSLYLQLFNLFDFCFGLLLIIFASYLYVTLSSSVMNVSTAWLVYSDVVMGGLLVLISLLSFSAVSSSSCRFLIVPTNYLSVFTASLCLMLSVTSFGYRYYFYKYLDSDEQHNLSDEDRQSIKFWYTTIAVLLLVDCIFELLRYKLSTGYRTIALKIDGEFDSLLAEHDQEWNELISSGQQPRAEKFKALKSHYKEKYERYFNDNESGDNQNHL